MSFYRNRGLFLKNIFNERVISLGYFLLVCRKKKLYLRIGEGGSPIVCGKNEAKVLSKLTQNYIKLLSKKRLYRGLDMKTYMRKKMLKGKEFIHSEGHWNDYLKYLRKEIPNA